jgi:hypothetical protein
LVLTGLLLAGSIPAALGLRLAHTRRVSRRPAVPVAREPVGVY